MLQFQADQLASLIEDLQRDQFSGIASLDVASVSGQQRRTRVLAFHEGWLTYAGLNLPKPQELAQSLGRKFKLQVMDSAIQLANKKVKNHGSVREFLELFVRLELFQWQDVKRLMENNVILTLEQVLPYAGTLTTDVDTPFDLHYGEQKPGFAWEGLKDNLAQRQQRWAAMVPVIPSMEAVPRRMEEPKPEIKDASIHQHLQHWVNGQRSLIDISGSLDTDPLELAHSYYHWAKKGWITCGNDAGKIAIAEPSIPKDLPVVLSVDDSSVVQTMIKRAISDRYQVLLANNAVDALNLLNSQNVSLMLLDVTMPEIDGLELCRTIRSISKFRELPVVMLTAKDGVINKLKGQMAGSTHYLTKPVTREKLLGILEKYIPSRAVV